MRKSANGSIGARARRSTATKAIASSRAAAASEPRIGGLPQPSALPRISAKVTRKQAAPKVDHPGEVEPPRGSGRATPAASAARARSAAEPIGRLTRKIQRQESPSTSRPPTSGPIASAPPVIAPQTPSAMPRSRPWNSAASSASEAANIAAAPTPWAPRARSRTSAEGAAPQSAEQAVKRARPATKIAPAPVAVGEHAGAEQGRGERQGVGVDHPLQLGEASRRGPAGSPAGRR